MRRGFDPHISKRALPGGGARFYQQELSVLNRLFSPTRGKIWLIVFGLVLLDIFVLKVGILAAFFLVISPIYISREISYRIARREAHKRIDKLDFSEINTLSIEQAVSKSKYIEIIIHERFLFMFDMKIIEISIGVLEFNLAEICELPSLPPSSKEKTYKAEYNVLFEDENHFPFAVITFTSGAEILFQIGEQEAKIFLDNRNYKEQLSKLIKTLRP